LALFGASSCGSGTAEVRTAVAPGPDRERLSGFWGHRTIAGARFTQAFTQPQGGSGSVLPNLGMFGNGQDGFAHLPIRVGGRGDLTLRSRAACGAVMRWLPAPRSAVTGNLGRASRSTVRGGSHYSPAEMHSLVLQSTPSRRRQSRHRPTRTGRSVSSGGRGRSEFDNYFPTRYRYENHQGCPLASSALGRARTWAESTPSNLNPLVRA